MGLPSQVKPGDAITADFLNSVIAKVLKTFKVGSGLALRRLGSNEVCIELTQSIPRRGGGGGNTEVTADSKSALEAMDLVEGDFCRTTGSTKRCYRYISGGLVCYTHLEEV